MSKWVRIGFLAGRGMAAGEIASQVDMKPADVAIALRAAGIRQPPAHRGLTVHLIVPIAAFVPDIDAVGQRRRMNREQIACELLRVVFSRGEPAMDAILDCGERV